MGATKGPHDRTLLADQVDERSLVCPASVAARPRARPVMGYVTTANSAGSRRPGVGDEPERVRQPEDAGGGRACTAGAIRQTGSLDPQIGVDPSNLRLGGRTSAEGS